MTTTQNQEVKRTVTVEQAASALGISRGAAYAAVQAGELPAFRIGRRWLVPVVELDRLAPAPRVLQ